MAQVRLNHKVVQDKMAKLLLRPVDLARKLGVSQQMGHFILFHGGLKYAPQLAKVFDCREAELLMNFQKEIGLKPPKGMVFRGNKLSKI